MAEDNAERNKGTPIKSPRYIDSSTSEEERIVKIVLVGDDTSELLDLAKKIKGVSEVLQSETGLDFVKDASECEISFVVANFEGELFSKLHRAQVRIIGPQVLKKCVQDGITLPLNIRPLYCLSMQDLVICFTGFRNKSKLVWLVDRVHYMGGSVRRDESIRLTHMVANVTHGTKYRYAVNMGKPIMCEDWISRMWADRDNPDCHASELKMAAYRMKPFYECCLCFLGFAKEEQKHMEELTIENGGTVAEQGAADLTHLVVDDQNVKEIPPDISLPQYVVRGEWFWGCIQMTACADEQIYTFEKISTPARQLRSSHSMTKNRKRKRLQELVAETEGSPYMVYKRRSSSAETSGTSMSPDSFLDVTYTPDKSDTHLGELKLENRDENTQTNVGKFSKRQMVVMELLQTEQNYVGILHTILQTFKAQIDKPDQYNGPILAPQDIKTIFGNIPPIYEVHCKLKDSLAFLVEHWSENNSIGECILNRAEELTKAYPPFVNFFEKTKETIQRCDNSNPRFHAFLKLCLSKPECGRQSLQELLIRPVQRLPSVILLLQDIHKRTESNNPDKVKLEHAIDKVKTIMTHINEDKRKTESRVVMFDIMNDIDNCPATLLSSNRHFVLKVDVMELSGNLASRGDPLTLFIFSDSVEICKRRLKVLTSSSKSPAVTSNKKSYKHVEMISMSSIKRVVDVEEAEDCCLAFGLVCRDCTQPKEKLYSFTLDTDDISKEDILTTICKNLAIVICRPDIGTFLAKVNGEELNITTKDLHKGNKASKFGRRVSRAFSFNKTPNKLKRAVSGMVHGLSPFVKDHKQFVKEGTVRRLASTIDLTEINDDSDTQSIGGFSLQDGGSPCSTKLSSPHRLAPPSLFLTPKSAMKVSKAPLKWATIGHSSASKSKYM
ncbi:hypothetical protein BsWGS_09714 [Bradybaena similaris]